jgi:hypothetical protein
LREIEVFDGICLEFHFKKKDKNPIDSILFCNSERIISLNFITKEIKTVYTYEAKLDYQPILFKVNSNQKVVCIADSYELKHVNIVRRREVEISYYL